MKKKNNPLRMLLPWVGIITPLAYLIYMNVATTSHKDMLGLVLAGSLFYGVVGFFVGWGITYLWRKYK